MQRKQRNLSATALFFALFGSLVVSLGFASEDPPTVNPFGPRKETRADAVPGYIELSNGKLLAGQLHLTRDKRLQIYDVASNRQREVPLRVIRHVVCEVDKEWMEREWRFKENANEEKLYTGLSYPARQYRHTITLQDGREIKGPLSGIIYVQSAGQRRPSRFLLHKRQKGPVGSELDSLVYVRRIELGDAALDAARKRIAKKESQQRDANPRDQ